MIRTRAAALAALLAAATPAFAQTTLEPSPPERSTESGRWGSFELSFGGWRPNVDAEFGGATPYANAFGTGRALLGRLDVAYTVFKDFGSVDVGLGAGYAERVGKGFLPGSLTPSGDATSIHIIPVRIHATYRFDYLSNRYRWFPIAPYARISLERYNWWVNNGAGDTATSDGRTGRGATNGYSVSVGAAFNLNAIDPGLAREMDRDTGVNHVYLFVDLTHSWIKDFGSSSSWDLSDDRTFAISGGILFVF